MLMNENGKESPPKIDKNIEAPPLRIKLDAMDCHDVSADRGFYMDVLRSMNLPMMIGSIDTDLLYRPSEQAELVTYLPNAYYVTINSRHGHDGFLMDAEQFARPISNFLATV